MSPDEVNQVIRGLWEVVDELSDVRAHIGDLKPAPYKKGWQLNDVRTGIRSIDEALAHIEAKLRETLVPVGYSTFDEL